MIKFENIGKSYNNQTVIKDLSLHLKKGEITVIIGPSGSGKSTTLKMINRLIDHDEGRILFDGEEIYSIPVEDLRRRMGYAVQLNGLFPHWTVAKNIACVPNLLKWDKQTIDTRVDELLEILALPPQEYRNKYPHELSGGQQQRVGVARALAANPEILLMDEPFGALDPVTRTSMQIEIKRIHALYNKTILLITHDIDEALFLADHLILMDKGAIVQQGTPMEILQNPKNAFVNNFIGEKNIGLKILSLQSVEEHMHKQQPIDNGINISKQTSLNEALSYFITNQCTALNIVDIKGKHLGVLRYSDLTNLSSLQGEG